MLARALGRARLALFWEQLWPALASIATAVGLFLALSWFGLWVSLPPLGRAIGLFAFFVLAVAATVPLFKVRWPDAHRRPAAARSQKPHAAPAGHRDCRPHGARGRRLDCGCAVARASGTSAPRSDRTESRNAGAARCQPRPLRVARARAHSRGRGVLRRRRRSCEARSPPRSTGTAWCRRPTTGSTPGSRRRPTPVGRR